MEADKVIRRRWRIGLGAALFVIFCFTTNAWMTSAARDLHLSSEERLLLEARRYLKAAALCSEIPKPELFRREGTRAPRHTSSSAQVFYGYRSERDFDETMPTFLVWFESNGWKRATSNDLRSPVENRHPNRQIIFVKPGSTVRIVYYYPDSDGYVPRANYELSCRSEDISFNISH